MRLTFLSDEGSAEALDDAQPLALPLSAAGRAASNIPLEDQRLLRDHGLDPALNCLNGYPRDMQPGFVSTDVFSFHADSATVETDTWLRTYHGPPTEGSVMTRRNGVLTEEHEFALGLLGHDRHAGGDIDGDIDEEGASGVGVAVFELLATILSDAAGGDGGVEGVSVLVDKGNEVGSRFEPYLWSHLLLGFLRFSLFS